MAIAQCRILCRVRAQYCVFGRRDRDLDCRSKSSDKQVRCGFSIVSSICEKQINGAVDLIQQVWQRCRIADLICGQLGTDDLATDKIETEVQLAPRAPFALGCMLFLKPFALTEYLQAGTVNDEVDRGLLVRPWTSRPWRWTP